MDGAEAEREAGLQWPYRENLLCFRSLRESITAAGVTMAAMISIVLILSAGWVLSGYLPTRNIKSPGYKVLERASEYEVRQYEPYIIAETPQEGGEKSGFRALFDYITGDNMTRATVEMTAPVIEKQQGEAAKIQMTAPVIKKGDRGGGTIAFVMPPGSKLASLPKPKNTRITLREIGPHKVAAVTFSGNPTREKIARQTATLLAAARRDGRRQKGEPQLALYNPPWTPFFMKKNEVMIELE